MNGSFKKGLTVGMLLGAGGGNMVGKSITENGTYTAYEEDPPVDGYSELYVNVETYEDELEEALRRIAELEAENAELQEKVDECNDGFHDVDEELDKYGFDPDDCMDVVIIIPQLYQQGAEQEEREDRPTPQNDPIDNTTGGPSHTWTVPFTIEGVPFFAEVGYSDSEWVFTDGFNPSAHMSATRTFTVTEYNEYGKVIRTWSESHNMNINVTGTSQGGGPKSAAWCYNWMDTARGWSGTTPAARWDYSDPTKISFTMDVSNPSGWYGGFNWSYTYPQNT